MRHGDDSYTRRHASTSIHSFLDIRIIIASVAFYLTLGGYD